MYGPKIKSPSIFGSRKSVEGVPCYMLYEYAIGILEGVVLGRHFSDRLTGLAP